MTRSTFADRVGERPGRDALAQLFQDTRRRLVDTGTRNRLVHVNRANTRGNVLNIVNARSDEVCSLLFSGKTLSFLARTSDQEHAADDARAVAVESKTDASPHARRSGTLLETRLGADALQKKLLKIAREAQTVEEETGVNILYIVFGFLTWFEHENSAVAREAPLVLVPVELVRNTKTSTYDVRARDEDIVTNLPLQQRLKEDFGLTLPNLDSGETLVPSEYFASVATAVSSRPGWKIDADGLQLGFFSFNKLLMFHDLDMTAWPDGALARHALVRGLLYEGFGSEKPLFGPLDRLDDVLPPEKIFHVVDADASQAKVIEEARSGRNLVVQGPPGTGKSQTITNIIASAVHDGKRVLFLAEKMAALSVVHERLVKTGLRDICLELHSKTVSKKVVVQELARTLSGARAVPSLPTKPSTLKEVRDKINNITDALHRPINSTGETPYSVLSLQCRFISSGYPPPTLRSNALVSMTRQQQGELLQSIAAYGELVAACGGGGKNPFEGARNLELQPVDLVRLEETLRQAQSALAALATALLRAGQTLAISEALVLRSADQLATALESVPRLEKAQSSIAGRLLGSPNLEIVREAVTAGIAWRDALRSASTKFIDSAFDDPHAELREAFSRGTRSFLFRWGGEYRRASRILAKLLREKLPKRARQRLEYAAQLVEIAELGTAVESHGAHCAVILGDAWQGKKTDFDDLLAILHWCERAAEVRVPAAPDRLADFAGSPEAFDEIRQGLRRLVHSARQAVRDVAEALELDPATVDAQSFEDADLTALSERFGVMASSRERYAEWSRIAKLRANFVRSGLAELEERMRSGQIDVAAASVELRFARAERLWRHALSQESLLKNVSLDRRHDLVHTFVEHERRHLKNNVTRIVAGHLAQLPQGAMGEMRVIAGEIGKKRGHIALRRLFERAGTAMQRIKPVLLMSPLSVAQFLPRGTISFDLLVIDEASQVRPEDALGAIARSAQIVVVGDRKQLPPTSFFDRVLADEEDDREGDDEVFADDLLGGAATLGEMESILTLCEARGIPSRMLNWHYRSRDPSLIEVSNKEFYDGNLILPPAPLQGRDALGLQFTRVDGVYDKGGKRDNRKEGDAIVERIVEHAKSNASLSLGVVTFSFAQRNVITELLELRRREDSILDEFLREGKSEDVFVKNIENVQGDERDVILISVGYGPIVQGGRLTSMSFGPINSDGGERRLNVLFTRARVRCEVFASFDPADIDVSRVTSAGPRILKRFLCYAQDRQSEERVVTGLGADSPFEEDVAAVVCGRGFLVDAQVGSAGFRIDLGVRHPSRPGTYILAVECDGASYHSALWARERDRLRQEVLESLGWKFHRIWSTDWFYNRHQEIERLAKALSQAESCVNAGLKQAGANRSTQSSGARPPSPDSSAAPGEIVVRRMPPYRRTVLAVRDDIEPHLAPPPLLADIVAKIVDAEGPIHEEEVARRLSACFGKEKAGSRILAATRQALASARSTRGDVLNDGVFWYTRAQAEHPPVRDRSDESGPTAKAESISLLEIREAVRIARRDIAGGDNDDIVRTAARLLGFRRVGADLQARISEGVSGHP